MITEKDQEFVDVAKMHPGIRIDMRYATENNFVQRAVYPVARCFLRRKVAMKLVLVQKWLEERGRGLKVLDAYRPLHVQKKFWEILPDERYVASPEKGSKHNRGAAVDLTLVDARGEELMMPTPFDDFTEKAHWAYQDLPQEVLANRTLLREAMEKQGFQVYPYEWWHYDDADWTLYPIEDVALEDIKE